MEDRRMITQLKYNILQFSYWVSFCLIVCFSSVYLLNEGASNTGIGMLLAAGNIISALLQQLIAVVTDRNEKLRLEYIVGVMFLGAAALSGVMYLCTGNLTVISALFVAVMVVSFSTAPSMTAMAFRAEEGGRHIDFAAARGIGSISYALVSVGAGYLFETVDTRLMPLFYGAFFVLGGVMSIACRVPERARVNGSASGGKDLAQETEEKAGKGFFSKYKMELLLFFGAVCIFIGHMSVNNFMKQVVAGVGGTVSQMGIAVSLAAFVEFPVMFFFSKLKKRFSCDVMLKFASVMFVAKMLITLLASSVAAIYAAAVLQMLSYALFVTAILYYYTKVMRGRDLGKGQALAGGVITVGSIFASFTGGWLIDTFGVRTMLAVSLAATVTGAATVFLSVRKIPPESD